MSSTDLSTLARPVLARRYDCDLAEAGAMLEEWATNTGIDVENVAAWVLWEAPALESAGELVSS